MYLKAKDVIGFWFEEIKPKQRWLKDEAFDLNLTNRFKLTHDRAAAGELFEWRKTAEGRLAEIIVLDQFSRNMFRNTPNSFAYDPIALILAQEAVSAGSLLELPAEYRSFLIMPYMHSESKQIHEISLALHSDANNKASEKFAKLHKDIIDRFGHYPHRNEILGRPSTEEEIEFLKGPGSSF